MGSDLRRCLGPNSNTAKIFDGELAAEDGHEATTKHHPHINSVEVTVPFMSVNIYITISTAFQRIRRCP
jgi:hypothetical protein